MRIFTTLIFVFLMSLSSLAQVKQASFLRIPDSADIHIDATGNEIWWDRAEPITGFIQQSPETGQQATQQTEVKVLYDNTALYIYAHMKETSRDSVYMEMSVRDELFGSNTDIFGIYIDAYQSGNSALGFFVSPTNIQSDIFYTPKNEDASWDVVWKSKTRITANGWYAEFKIPYSAIRFANKDRQSWNINFIRRIRRNRETAHWNFVDPNIDGFINQFGTTDTLINIDPPLRLSFTPYLAGVTQRFPGFDWDNYVRGGMDLKWGIDESFTLDVTLIPDFSQVRTDNEVLNLSPFEVQFQENRPFFTEGIDLFSRGELFYSRRIGNQPIYYEQALFEEQENEELQIVENPATTQLLNATKLSGRTNQGLGIGVLNAIVNQSTAVLENNITGEQRKIKTQPLTNYNMVVLDQNLAHNSSIALINTNVWRNGPTYDANVTALETRLRNKAQTYQISGFTALSQKYFSDLNDLGYRFHLNYGKISGTWRWEGAYNVESDNYDTNDFGFLPAANERTFTTTGGYHRNQTFGDFVRANVILTSRYKRLQSPNKYAGWEFELNSFLLSKNFWGYGIFGTFQPLENHDYFEPRTLDFTRYLPVPQNYSVGGFISSNYARPFALDLRVQYHDWDSPGRHSYFIAAEPRFRFSDRFNLITGINYTEFYNDQGWVAPVMSGFEDVLIGDRDQYIFVTYILSKYTFTNRINFNIRLRHYWSNVQYHNFLRLDENSELSEIDYPGSENEEDINFNTLNIDAQFTWRFAPGSDLILSWNGQLISFTETDRDKYLYQFNTILSEPQQTTLSLKVLYYLDYQTVMNTI